MIRRQLKYLATWKGYDERSWQPQSMWENLTPSTNCIPNNLENPDPKLPWYTALGRGKLLPRID